MSYINDHRDRFTSELQTICQQPSIAAQNVGMQEMAAQVLERLESIGAEAQIIEVEGGAPVVYGEIGTGDRTLMIYNHYDVQPPEPLELWDSDPFSAEIRDGRVYARGVADNKGNLMARLHAIETWQASQGDLPLRIKFVVEGEEEIGSPHLSAFVEENHSLVEGADGCLWEAGYRDHAERPVISLGLKGIQYVELRTRGATHDLHSAWGTVVPNPVWRLVWALATLKDEDDHILVEGFMDEVAEPSKKDMAALEIIPLEEEQIKEDFGIPRFVRNLSGVVLLKKHLYEPTCTISGIIAGYTGEGSKTVLPSGAKAKVDFRLVPNLTPERVLELLRQHLDKQGFEDVEIVDLCGEPPARSDPKALIAQAAVEAAREVYRQEPVVYPTMAGSGPMYVLCQGLGIPAASMGVGHAGSNVHAPNENIRLEDYFQGIEYIGALIRRFTSS